MCVTCGSLNDGTSVLVRNDDRKRLRLGSLIGKTRTTSSPFPLPAWGDHVLGIPPNAGKYLFQGWRGMNQGQLSGNLQARLDIAHKSIATSQLSGLPRVTLDSKVISHVIDSDKSTGEHVMYAPLILQSLNEPDSVWCNNHAGKDDQLSYLKRYRVGTQTITHLVIVDEPGEFIRSAYRITYRSPEKYRFGVFRYSARAIT